MEARETLLQSSSRRHRRTLIKRRTVERFETQVSPWEDLNENVLYMAAMRDDKKRRTQSFKKIGGFTNRKHQSQKKKRRRDPERSLSS